ncbi:retrotransposon protein, putative, ty1-copia subclass [Tanacetum coccineum]
MDVKTAFLNGKLTEDEFMAQPEGFENEKYLKRVCKLQKAIYGLEHASLSGSVVVFLVLYVDDILLIGNDIPTLQSVKDWLGRCFAMKDLGDASYILGIKIYKDRTKRLIGLSQDTYLDNILKRSRMENSKKGNLPLHHGIKISKDLCPKTDDELDKMSRVPYASTIGSIMYAMTCTRPGVSFALSMVSRHQQNPGEGHWTTVKYILRYLRNTKDRFLVYGGEKELRVTGYCDAGWQTDKDDSRSQSGWVFLLNGGAVTWKSSKQDTVAGSTCESKYIAALEEGHVIVKDIRSEDNLVDPFTKALAKSKHDEHAKSIGLKDKIEFLFSAVALDGTLCLVDEDRVMCCRCMCFSYFIWPFPFRAKLSSIFCMAGIIVPVHKVGMPISAGITASVPYVSENGMSSLLDLIMVNKKDERGIVIKKKARLVAQGYTQEEGINYDEVFAPVAKIEAIRLFLAYASFKDFVVYQMDVKSAFLYGKIEEDCLCLSTTLDLKFRLHDSVYKVEENRLSMDRIKLPELGLQVKQKEDGIFISQDKYVTEILKKFGFSDVKTASTPMETHKPFLKDVDGDYVDGHIFQVSPKVSHLHAEQAKIGSPQQEAEYVAASSCCGQVLWIQNQLLDYGYNFMHTKIYIDNKSTICIVKNPVFHLKIKHIEFRHHFIRDSNEKKLIQMIKLHTDKNVTDLLTKAFDNRIGVNAGNSKLMMLGINLLQLLKVNAARHKLTTAVENAEGIECLPNADIFEQLALMGYEKPSQKLTFYKAFFSPQWKFLIHTILQCLKPVVDEVIHKERGDSVERAVTIASSLEVEQDSGMKRLFKIGRSARVISSDEDTLGDQEDASKQGRKITDIDQDAEQSEKVVEEVFSTAEVSAATTITTKEIILAQALAALKSAKPNVDKPSETRTTTKTKTTPITSSKDKGKGIMVEEPLKMKKKDQVLFDEQESIRLQAQFDEEERIAREKEEVNATLIGRIVRIKSLPEVTTVKVCVTAAKHKLVLLVILMKNMLSINAACTKVTTVGVKGTTAGRIYTDREEIKDLSEKR